MTILSVGYPLSPVGPDSGGGAEQILYLVERGLVSRGHRSIVIAAAGSRVCGELMESPAASSVITEQVRRSAEIAHLQLIDSALERNPIDLIHFHGLDFHAYVPSRELPKLATLHLPIHWYPESIFEIPSTYLNCVSRTQAASAPPRFTLPVVTNGIDIESYHLRNESKKFLLWLGRVCPEKGVNLALRVAHRLNEPMIVAGPVQSFREHQLYFSDHVQPVLDERRRYIGPVGLDQKTALLSEAKCLLITSSVAETSSLVAMEACASGIPVVAMRSGALPEIVEHEKTGFIVDSEDEMVEAVRHIGEISSNECCAVAEARFDSNRMVCDYLKLYEISA